MGWDIGTTFHHPALSENGGNAILLRRDVAEIEGGEIHRADIVRCLVVAHVDGEIAALIQSARALGDANVGELHVIILLVRVYKEAALVVASHGQVLLHRGDDLPLLTRMAEAQHGIEGAILPGGEHCGVDFYGKEIGGILIVGHDSAVFLIAHEQGVQSSIGIHDTQGKVGFLVVSFKERIGWHSYVTITHDRVVLIDAANAFGVLGGLWLHLRVGVDNGTLPHAKADAAAAAARTGVVVGIEHGECKIAVDETSPAPVDVEQAVAIIAVAHEAMSTVVALAAINHRTSCGQFAIDSLLPCVDDGEETALDELRSVVVEVIVEGFCYLKVICYGAAYLSGAIHRLYGLSAVAHQRGNGLALLVGT